MNERSALLIDVPPSVPNYSDIRIPVLKMIGFNGNGQSKVQSSHPVIDPLVPTTSMPICNDANSKTDLDSEILELFDPIRNESIIRPNGGGKTSDGLLKLFCSTSTTIANGPRERKPVPALLKIPRKPMFRSSAAELIYQRSMSTSLTLGPQAIDCDLPHPFQSELPNDFGHLYYSEDSD